MSSIIEQVISVKSYGIKEYALQLDRQINASGLYKGYVKNFNETIGDSSIGVFHFSNASRHVLMALARRKNRENLVIVHDILPRTNFVKYLYPFFMRIIDKKAKTIIVHSHSARRLLLQQNPQFAPEKVTVIPHGTFTYDVTPMEKQQIRQRYGFRDNDRLLYMLGGITRKRGQIQFLKTFDNTAPPNLKLLVAGKCKDSKAVEIMERNNSIHYYGFASKQEIDNLYKICDSVVVFRKDSVGESSSTIAYGLGFGKPLLVSNNGPFEEMLGNAGILFDNHEDSIKQLLVDITTKTINLGELTKKSKIVRNRYQWEGYLKKMFSTNFQ